MSTSRILATSALALSLATPGLLSAQGGTAVGISAGLTIPTGSIDNRVDNGYHLQASLAVQPPASVVGLRLDGMFNEFDQTAIPSGKLRVWGFTGNAVITPPGIVGPYLIGGLGVYNVSQPAGIAGSSDANDIGFNLGAGFRFALTGFSAFAEARYHRVGDTDVRFIPLTFGVLF